MPDSRANSLYSMSISSSVSICSLTKLNFILVNDVSDSRKSGTERTNKYGDWKTIIYYSPPIHNKCCGFSSFLVKFELKPQHLLWIGGSIKRVWHKDAASS
jgi:hypothetical protein